MAVLPCKLIAQVSFKASGGHVFHHLFANKPDHLPKAAPGSIKSCELLQGEFGTNGSLLDWKYQVDGKDQSSKTLQEIDTNKKEVTFHMLEGDTTELYKNFVIKCHVETKNGVDLVIWTFDYELVKPENAHPVALLNYCMILTAEIESHIYG